MMRICSIGLIDAVMKDIHIFKIAFVNECTDKVIVTCQDTQTLETLTNALIDNHLSFYDIHANNLQMQIPSQCFNEQIYETLRLCLLKNNILLCQSKIDMYNKVVIVNNGNHILPYSLYTLQLAPWLRSCEWFAKHHKLYDVDNVNYAEHFAITEKVCKVNDNGIGDYQAMQSLIQDMLHDTNLQDTTEVLYIKLHENELS